MAYKAVFKCESCAMELSDHEKMYSDGVCPHCGAISGSTIVRVVTDSVLIQTQSDILRDSPLIQCTAFAFALGVACTVVVNLIIGATQ